LLCHLSCVPKKGDKLTVQGYTFFFDLSLFLVFKVKPSQTPIASPFEPVTPHALNRQVSHLI